MKTTRLLLLFGAALLLLLSACGGGAAPPPEEPPPPPPEPAEPVEPAEPAAPEPTEPPAAEPTEPPATEAPAAAEPAGGPPEDLPEYTGIHLYDHNKGTAQGSVIGDRWGNLRFERPYDTDVKGNYYAHLDITDVWHYDTDAQWTITIIGVLGTDSNNALSGKYAVEIDDDLGGYGSLFVLVDPAPTSSEWTTAGVQIFKDNNSDVGGKDAILPDGESGVRGGDGFETALTGDPAAAWTRLSSEYPNAVEIAFKNEITADGKFMIGAWAGTEDLDPAMFDLNDNYTHEQAGALNIEYEGFYPLNELTQIDNTCRLGIGFEPAATVKGLCP